MKKSTPWRDWSREEKELWHALYREGYLAAEKQGIPERVSSRERRAGRLDWESFALRYRNEHFEARARAAGLLRESWSVKPPQEHSAADSAGQPHAATPRKRTALEWREAPLRIPHDLPRLPQHSFGLGYPEPMDDA